MKIEVHHIMATNKTPEVLLDPKGIIKISGRAIDESRNQFSEQIITWLDAYLLNPAESTEVTIALEYLNSYNSMIIASIIKKLAMVKQQSKGLLIKWYVEDDDEDLLERGKYISSTFNIPIEFILTDKLTN